MKVHRGLFDACTTRDSSCCGLRAEAGTDAAALLNALLLIDDCADTSSILTSVLQSDSFSFLDFTYFGGHPSH